MRASPLLLLVAMLLAASTGCETLGNTSSCDASAAANPTVRYAGGTTKDGVYTSLYVDGSLLYFPGGMHYALEHQLGRTPDWWFWNLSFESDGLSDAGAGNLAQAAGNQVELLGMDAETIDVANDSCSDYYLLVKAGTSATAPNGP